MQELQTINVLRRMMMDQSRPEDERAACATALLLICDEAEAGEQTTDTPEPVNEQDAKDAEIELLLSALRSRNGVSRAA